MNAKALIAAVSADSWQSVKEYLSERMQHYRSRNDIAEERDIHRNQGAIEALKDLIALDTKVREVLKDEMGTKGT